jgi:hypothetical protein
MNDINELIRIIDSLSGVATSEAIVKEYCKEHCMVIQPHFKRIVEKTLSEKKKSIRRNNANGGWELTKVDTVEYLYVAENQYFNTIRDAMLQVFRKSVPLSQGYFKVDEDHMAWFPQPNNDNWENILSEDGKYWFEKPKDESSEYKPDFKLRYVFAREDSGYRFTGLYKFSGVNKDQTRIYELIDDKVRLIKPRPYLIVCRVAYMKYYDGITGDDVPVNGGSFVTENNDAYEKNNFHRYEDGNCYIFIETKYKSGHIADNNFAKAINIEQIDPLYKGKDSITGVRVVLMAFSPIKKKNVVVGWYDNATVFRNRIVEPDKTYMMKCSFSDAHLIPEANRSFEVPRAQGNDFGIGQSNFWYIQKSEAARTYEDSLIEYIDSLYS